MTVDSLIVGAPGWNPRMDKKRGAVYIYKSTDY
jgi:hypothetical protein